MPPIPPPIGASYPLLGDLDDDGCVVISILETDTAFSRASLVTLTGSMIPLDHVHELVVTGVITLALPTAFTITAPSLPAFSA